MEGAPPRQAPPQAAPLAAQTPPPTIVIHHHYERQPPAAASSAGVALAADVSGPAWGTVHRNAQGHVTDVNGLNLALGWSWKRYTTDVARPMAGYRTFGTLGLVVPHFEVGVDYRRQM